MRFILYLSILHIGTSYAQQKKVQLAPEKYSVKVGLLGIGFYSHLKGYDPSTILSPNVELSTAFTLNFKKDWSIGVMYRQGIHLHREEALSTVNFTSQTELIDFIFPNHVVYKFGMLMSKSYFFSRKHSMAIGVTAGGNFVDYGKTVKSITTPENESKYVVVEPDKSISNMGTFVGGFMEYKRYLDPSFNFFCRVGYLNRQTDTKMIAMETDILTKVESTTNYVNKMSVQNVSLTCGFAINW